MLFCTYELGRHGFSYRLRRRNAVGGELTHEKHGIALLPTSPSMFEHFQTPGDPGRERRKMAIFHIQSAVELTLCMKGGNTGVRAAGNRLRNRMNCTLKSSRLSRPFGVVGLPSSPDEYNRHCGVCSVNHIRSEEEYSVPIGSP